MTDNPDRTQFLADVKERLAKAETFEDLTTIAQELDEFGKDHGDEDPGELAKKYGRRNR